MRTLSGMGRRAARWLALPRKLEGQTTVEYTLIIACVALPLSIVFVRWGQKFFAGIMSRIIKQFPWYGY
ncbi:MAG: hypothetical protein U0166_21110 [Acidobacteriota bacterium]